MLLRKTCRIYNDFIQYCTRQRITLPLKSDSLPKKSLPSPELGPLKMLSPFASIKKMTPLIKTETEAQSMLMQIAAKKRGSIPDIKTFPKKLKEQGTFKIEKSKPLMKPVKFTKLKPISPKESKKELIGSPLASTEGARFVGQVNSPKRSSVVVCACGAECEDDICKICSDKLNSYTKTEEVFGYLYEKSDSKTLNRFWFSLIGDKLYRYNSKKDTESIDTYFLIGSFFKEEPSEYINKKLTIFPLRIYLGTKQLVLYAIKAEEATMWTNALKKSMNYSDLTDHYELGIPLGRGKFGFVRTAIHKKSKTEVAIKIINKEKLSANDLTLAKREIEILKVCQHPNIVRLFDTYENANYIYIVVEFLKGGDLYNYLVNNHYKIPEGRVREIMHSLATALYYLHSYGIVHRDIKLENILLGSNGEAKLTDFGLSKMIGPNETCFEPFGTIGYAAPEIILGKGYGKEVDIWSLGIVLFILLTGHTPFDQESEEQLAVYDYL